MQLAHQSDEGHHAVRRLGAGFVQVGDRVFSASLLLAPDRCIDDFAPHSLDEFDAAAIAAVLALEPTVVLIGTGERQRLAPPALMAAFLARGIGLEAMDSAAAARTFNLLAGEGRRVVAAFLIGTAAS
ncbi:MAG TPA: MTH938/NDUFAF3 family protein [Chiayiivirga sp.]|nr:MTH938/NDUFAF3 family protein [Chiayiivirga sp.]